MQQPAERTRVALGASRLGRGPRCAPPAAAQPHPCKRPRLLVRPRQATLGNRGSEGGGGNERDSNGVRQERAIGGGDERAQTCRTRNHKPRMLTQQESPLVAGGCVVVSVPMESVMFLVANTLIMNLIYLPIVKN